MKGRDSKNQYPEPIQEKVRAALRGEGKTPVILSDEEMATLGHVRKRASRAIREMCIDCMGGETLQSAKADIAACTSVGCPLWPFRSGRSPWIGKNKRQPTEGDG